MKVKGPSFWPFLSGILATILMYEMAPKILLAAVGEENASLIAIKADTAAVLVKLKDAVDTYNKVATATNGVLDNTKNGYNLANKIANYNDTIEDQKRFFKRFADGFYGAGKDPLNHRIPLINTGSMPIIRDTGNIVDGLQSTFGEKGIGKNQYAGETRARVGLVLGKVAAKDARDKVNDLKLGVSKNPSVATESAAEAFGKVAHPINTDLMLLLLESSIRQEELLASIAGALSRGKPIEAKPMNKDDLERTLKNYKEGKGTLLEND